MPDSFNQRPAAKPAPQITSLSTAFPMHFESSEPVRNTSPRTERSNNTAQARSPHRHDAGE